MKGLLTAAFFPLVAPGWNVLSGCARVDEGGLMSNTPASERVLGARW